MPLNVYAGYPGAASASTLGQRGARRISLGCGTMQATLGHLRQIATEALSEGRYDSMASTMLTVSQANDLFSPAAIRHDVPAHRMPATGSR